MFQLIAIVIGTEEDKRRQFYRAFYENSGSKWNVWVYSIDWMNEWRFHMEFSGTFHLLYAKVVHYDWFIHDAITYMSYNFI